MVLPCPSEQLGCETTSLDSYAYTWAEPDNCVLAVHRKEMVNMIKHGSNYYIVSGNDSITKFLFEIYNRPQKYCNKPDDVYPTNYESLYVSIQLGGFDMTSGRRLGISMGETSKLHYFPSEDMVLVMADSTSLEAQATPTLIHHITSIWITSYTKEQNSIIFSLRALTYSRPQRPSSSKHNVNKKELKSSLS